MMKPKIRCADSNARISLPQAIVRSVVASFFIFNMPFLTRASAEDETPADRSSQRTRQTEQEPAGIVLRFSERLFHTPQNPEINRLNHVRTRILGICNVGTSHIVGHLVPDFRPKSDGISMHLKFYGTTTSRTTGRKKRAQIHSVSIAKFLVVTPLELDMETGFSAGHPSSNAQIVRTCRSVTARGAGLLAPIVKATARKRVRRQEALARRETERVMERRLTSDSATEIEQRLKQWNENWQTLRQALETVTWYREELPVQFATDDSHLILFIDVEPDTQPQKDSKQVVKFPPEQLPEHVSHSIVDVIIYQKDIDRSEVAVIMKLVESIINRQFAESPQVERASIDTQTGDDWVMLSVILEPAGNRASRAEDTSIPAR